MSTPLVRRALTATALSTLSVALMASMSSAAEAATVYAYGGSAYGTMVDIGTLKSGQTSYVPMCTTKSTYSKSNNTAALPLGLVGNTGAVTTKVKSHKSGSTRTSTTTTKTAASNLLGGLVTAEAITSEAVAKHSSKGYDLSGTSTFLNLRVAGIPVKAKPAKNTKISIPGIATVLLNTQSTSTANGNHAVRNTALKLTLLDGNLLGLPTGTVIIGTAKASIHSPVHNRPYGNAFGTQVDLAGVVKSGPTAAVYIPCGGSNSAKLTNSVASGDLPGVIDAGAVSSSGKSTDSSSKTTATTTTSLADIDVLDGIITADAVSSSAVVTRKGKKLTRTSTTKVLGLKINDTPVTVTPAENSSINILNVGTLYIRKATKLSTGLQVYALQLKLSTEVQGLTTGTVINIGAAKAGVTYH